MIIVPIRYISTEIVSKKKVRILKLETRHILEVLLTLISNDLETVSLLKVKAALEQLDMASTNTENKLKIKFFFKEELISNYCFGLHTMLSSIISTNYR